MNRTISTSFTATGAGNELAVREGEKFAYSVSGTFSGTVVIEQEGNHGRGPQWDTLATLTAAGSGYLKAEDPGRRNVRVRVRCTVYVSGTIVTTLSDAAAAARVVVGGGTFTTAGGDASESIPLAGCQTGDTAVVWVQKAGGTPRTVNAATAGEEAIAVTMSGDPSTDHTLAFLVLRAQPQGVA